MTTILNWHRIQCPLTRLTWRYGSIRYDWPPRPFEYPPETPHLEPTHLRGEGKFAFPESINNKYEKPFKIPPIRDLSYAGRRVIARKLWYTKVLKLGTVEEKIYELNMPKFYGWRPYVIREGVMDYDPLPKIQYMTRTCVMKEPGLPDYYNSLMSEQELDDYVKQIKGQIEDAVALEFFYKE